MGLEFTARGHASTPVYSCATLLRVDCIEGGNAQSGIMTSCIAFHIVAKICKKGSAVLVLVSLRLAESSCALCFEPRQSSTVYRNLPLKEPVSRAAQDKMVTFIRQQMRFRLLLDTNTVAEDTPEDANAC